MHIRITGLLFTLAACLLGAGRALGCTCFTEAQPCHEYGRASAVFVGTVTGVVTHSRERDTDLYRTPRVFRFSVEQSYLGVVGHEVEVATGMGGGDCGYDFRPGEKYLVYANRSKDGARLTTSICMRTRPYHTASDDLQFLNGLAASPPGVQLTGYVRRTRRGSNEQVGVPSVALVLTGEGRTQELLTDEQGHYRLAGLRPGAYKIELRAPPGFTTHRPARELKIVDRGCAREDFVLADDGRVSGRVTDADGRPVPKILLNLLPDVEAGKEFPNLLYAEADGEGRFEFKAVPPGSYVLGVRLGRGARALAGNPNSEFPRTYYPGVAEASAATPVILGEGERVAGRDLRLPPRLVPRLIRGRAIFADGRPAAGATVLCHNLTYGSDCESHAQVGPQGAFTLRAYEGFEYLVRAFVNLEGGRQMHAEWAELPAGDGAAEFVLRLSEPNGNCARCAERTLRRPPRDSTQPEKGQ
jgi:hypothetical protein